MITHLKIGDEEYTAKLNEPIDISIPLHSGNDNVNAWYAPPPEIVPVRMDSWVGEVAQGAAVNFRNVFFNPHAHGTHTECVGHITKEWVSLNSVLKQFFFTAKLVTVLPIISDGDMIITKEDIVQAWNNCGAEALVIRTLPNDNSKQRQQRGWQNKTSSTCYLTCPLLTASRMEENYLPTMHFGIRQKRFVMIVLFRK